jgi:hypothetical protein
MFEISTLCDRDSSNLPRPGKPRLLLTIQSLRHDPACEYPRYETNVPPQFVLDGWRARTRPSYLPGQVKCINVERCLHRTRDGIPLQPLEPVLGR